MMKKLNFLGLGFEFGQDHIGLAESPDFIRRYFSVFRNMGLSLTDCGNIIPNNQTNNKIKNIQDLEKYDWQAFESAFHRITDLLDEDETLLNWGGDHSMGLATVAAFLEKYPNGKVLWVDAHADLNLPPFSPTGNLHGMPISLLMNLNHSSEKNIPWIRSFLKSENIIYLGLRSVDPFEERTIQDMGIDHYKMADIIEKGIDKVANEILEKTNSCPLHISFDVDSMCPEYAPSTGVPVPGGMSRDDIESLGKTLSNHTAIKSIDISEINPLLGTKDEVLRTCTSAIKFIVSLMNSDHPSKGVLYDELSNATSPLS